MLQNNKSLIDNYKRINIKDYIISSKEKVDLQLFLVSILLLGLGVAFIYSAGAPFSINIARDASYIFTKQLIFTIVSIGMIYIFSKIHPKVYFEQSNLLIIAIFISLLIVLVIGKEVKGATRWIALGLFDIQPSEFAKLGVIIYLSSILTKKKDIITDFKRAFLAPLFIVSIVCFLVLVEADLSTSLIIFFISLSIFFIAGIPLTYIVTLIICLIPCIWAILELLSHSKSRLKDFILQFLDPTYQSYQIKQAYEAYRQGGLWGKGFGLGIKNLHLPEAHTDFIFPSIAFCAGSIVCLIIVVLFMLFAFRGYILAFKMKEDNNFLCLLSFGLVSYILLQSITNISAVLGLIPTTGITLPFLSYGGSSLFSVTIAVGILLSISRIKHINK